MKLMLPKSIVLLGIIVFCCVGLTFANDPKGEPPTDEPCCPEGSELVAEYEEVIEDPKGSPTRIKHGEMGKPGIRLGTPYSPGQRIDGMEVLCVEVSHHDDCEEPVLTMFGVGEVISICACRMIPSFNLLATEPSFHGTGLDVSMMI